MIIFILDVLSSLSIVASIPVLTLADDLRLALCLLGTGIAVHIVLRWYFHFETVPDLVQGDDPGESEETSDDERKDSHD